MPCLELDAYASHLPVLEALSKLLPMRRVLEFGAGRYSTPFFRGLEELEELCTIEPDPLWRERVESTDHWHSVLAKRSSLTPPCDFDLVFIDDGHLPAGRVETIRWVLGQEHPPVVIHDAEVPRYQAAIHESGAYSFTFKWGEPWTALVWR